MYEYETLTVLHPDLGEAGAREQVERMRATLEGEGAEIKKIDEWGLRELAYAIQKQHRGIYVLFEYRSEPRSVWEFERLLKLNDQVLRFVSVRQVHKKAPPPRRSRPEREGHAGSGESAGETS